jgi:hypothetical protein
VKPLQKLRYKKTNNIIYGENYNQRKGFD